MSFPSTPHSLSRDQIEEVWNDVYRMYERSNPNIYPAAIMRLRVPFDVALSAVSEKLHVDESVCEHGYLTRHCDICHSRPNAAPQTPETEPAASHPGRSPAVAARDGQFDKCHICGGAALTRGDGCGIEKCPYRGGPFSGDKRDQEWIKAVHDACGNISPTDPADVARCVKAHCQRVLNDPRWFGYEAPSARGDTFEIEHLRISNRTLAQECERYNMALSRLREWDMIAEPSPGVKEPCADAPWARRLIDDALSYVGCPSKEAK